MSYTFDPDTGLVIASALLNKACKKGASALYLCDQQRVTFKPNSVPWIFFSIQGYQCKKNLFL